MTTSKIGERSLCSLLFKTTPNYDANLQTLLTLINQSKEKSIIVAPEVCLTGFDYENLERVLEFAQVANEELAKASMEKIVICSIIEKIDDKIFNLAKVFYNGKVIHARAKARLFRFGGEHKHFDEGMDEDIEILEIDGMKIAILICFELRFKQLWQRIEGADVIAVPSWWGVLRSEHFASLTQTLAIMNQCYVVASDSLNDECSKLSGVITPQGKVSRNKGVSRLEVKYEKKEITLMRKYLDVGIS